MPSHAAMPRVPLDLMVQSPEGEGRPLGELLTSDHTIIQLVRYFGCLPCQEWLIDLDRRADQLADEGIGAIAIGGSADYQATWLREEKDVRIPLYLDPDQALRPYVGAEKALGWRMADPRGAVAYARSLRHGYRPQKVTHDTVRSPGVIVLDQSGSVRWRHIGSRIGDYPAVDAVVAAVQAMS